ncbi:MAG TPA: hypothetical protein VLQ80_02365 [Candidatus Saccharimonadia bacterium]|nr:hypothetical protein [Candidatus Saccharimonadia bacterium]
MCRQIGTTSTVYYDGNGRVLNTTTSPVTVTCPIVRDANQTKWQFVEVVVADRNPNTNVTCAARSNQTDGLGWSSNPINPLPAGFVSLNWWESQTLTFYSPTEERHDGTYFISCSIPPRYTNGANYDSGIYSYRIREFTGCIDPD